MSDNSLINKNMAAALSKLAPALLNLEYQERNQMFLPEKEKKKLAEDKENVVSAIVDLLAMEQQRMKYPVKMEEWKDSGPLQSLNLLSGGRLAQTEWYQGILGNLMIFGTRSGRD